jgi:hypothetical protein
MILIFNQKEQLKVIDRQRVGEMAEWLKATVC